MSAPGAEQTWPEPFLAICNPHELQTQPGISCYSPHFVRC